MFVKENCSSNINNNGSLTKKSKLDGNDNIYVFNGSIPSNSLISILEDKLRPYILHFLDSVPLKSSHVFENLLTVSVF